MGYPDVDALQRLLTEREIPVEDEAYGADVRYRCAVPRSELAAFTKAVADLSRGEGTVRADGPAGPDGPAGRAAGG